MTHSHTGTDRCPDCDKHHLYEQAPTAMGYSTHHAIQEPEEQGQLFDPEALFNDRRK